MAIVVNVSGLSAAERSDLQSDPGFVYVGRGNAAWKSKGWGNPFPVSKHGHGTAIELHKAKLWEQIKSGEITLPALATLDDKVLGCHCAPEGCHGDTLAAAAAWARQRLADGSAETYCAPKAHRDFRYATEFNAWREREGLTENPAVLVCGQREFSAPDVVVEAVSKLAPGTVVIEGEARGADTAAAEAALARGLPLAGFPARWEPHQNTPSNRIRYHQGKAYDTAAGFMRNTRMLACQPERVIALADWEEPTGGTGHTVTEALALGIPVTVVNSKGEEHELLSRVIEEDS